MLYRNKKFAILQPFYILTYYTTQWQKNKPLSQLFLHSFPQGSSVLRQKINPRHSVQGLFYALICNY